jgi:hypothetical protein
VHGETCFAVADPAELVATVQSCLALPAERVAAMRAALRPLVAAHVVPGGFARALELDALPPALSVFWFERA